MLRARIGRPREAPHGGVALRALAPVGPLETGIAHARGDGLGPRYGIALVGTGQLGRRRGAVGAGPTGPTGLHAGHPMPSLVLPGPALLTVLHRRHPLPRLVRASPAGLAVVHPSRILELPRSTHAALAAPGLGLELPQSTGGGLHAPLQAEMPNGTGTTVLLRGPSLLPPVRPSRASHSGLSPTGAVVPCRTTDRSRGIHHKAQRPPGANSTVVLAGTPHAGPESPSGAHGGQHASAQTEPAGLAGETINVPIGATQGIPESPSRAICGSSTATGTVGPLLARQAHADVPRISHRIVGPSRARHGDDPHS